MSHRVPALFLLSCFLDVAVNLASFGVIRGLGFVGNVLVREHGGAGAGRTPGVWDETAQPGLALLFSHTIGCQPPIPCEKKQASFVGSAAVLRRAFARLVSICSCVAMLSLPALGPRVARFPLPLRVAGGT